MAQKGVLTTADYLSEKHFNALIDGLHNDKLYTWELFCRIAFCCALRCSDVLALKWCDILDKNEIIVTEIKTGKTRKIPVNESVKHKIRQLYMLMGKPSTNQYIIYNPKSGTKYTIQTVNEKLKEFRVDYRIKIKNFSTHTFRKTFGRMVYEQSGKSAESLILLNTIFKHANIQTTKTYIGITQDEISGVFNHVNF